MPRRTASISRRRDFRGRACSPLVAGAAALIKQQHPNFTLAQIESALVNTANPKAVAQDDQGNDVDTQSIGNGLLDAGAAAVVTVLSNPATFSFGAVTKPPATQQVQLTNTGSSSVTLAAAVAPNFTGSGVTPTLDKTSVTIEPNASAPLSLALKGRPSTQDRGPARLHCKAPASRCGSRICTWCPMARRPT